jgi:hypothetical protein
MRTVQLRLPSAVLLAAAITLLTASAWINNALWIFNWLLLCPAWYLVATARRAAPRRKQKSATSRRDIAAKARAIASYG